MRHGIWDSWLHLRTRRVTSLLLRCISRQQKRAMNNFSTAELPHLRRWAFPVWLALYIFHTFFSSLSSSWRIDERELFSPRWSNRATAIHTNETLPLSEQTFFRSLCQLVTFAKHLRRGCRAIRWNRRVGSGSIRPNETTIRQLSINLKRRWELLFPEVFF